MRAAALAALLLATPTAAADEAVRFPSGSIELAGTLSLPDTPGPYPAVVLISGSGPSNRDEAVDGVAIKPFALIAAALNAKGIAVLRYDDRGVGESSGTYDGATLDDFAADAAAALAFLHGRDDIRDGAIGLIGHSEGGMIAPMVIAARQDEVAFVAVLAPPAVNGHDFLVGQVDAQLKGRRNDEKKAMLLSQREALDLVTAGDWPGLERNLRAQYLRVRRTFTGTEQDYVTSGLHFFRGWLRSFALNDPAVSWRQVRVPVLGLYGDRDMQVSADQNAPALKAALDGNPDVTIVRLPTANHLFQDAPTGAISEYGSLPAAFAPDVLSTLTAWLLKHTGAAD